MTPVTDLGKHEGNRLFIKRDDLIPFSFGGNKARKAELFFREIDADVYDCVVTYGTGSSNHCRVVANACRSRALECRIISPLEGSGSGSFNRRMVEQFGAEIFTFPVAEIHDAIERELNALRAKGRKPYFIEGGGHGNLGTEAYVRCYEEIRRQEAELDVFFDRIYFASGTGTTQAGLVCGQLIHGDSRIITGISIARKNPRGRNVVLDSIHSYLGSRADEAAIGRAIVFLDEYTDGYAADDERVRSVIRRVLDQYGIPLDPIYTGKAFMGMEEDLRKTQTKGQNILFIHTGGTPLFFDEMEKWT